MWRKKGKIVAVVKPKYEFLMKQGGFRKLLRDGIWVDFKQF
jgi:hypothetical protein